jgi:uncharacterized membrane protein
MAEALNVIMRWLHISSVVTLVGGIVYGRLVVWPAMQSLAPEVRKPFDESVSGRFRPLVFSATAGLLMSGMYNIFSNPGHSPRYHMLLGIKFLLVLHVFAVAILVTQPHNQRRGRMMTGTLISGLIIVAISAYLRRIF